jgi:hypothetical protein
MFKIIIVAIITNTYLLRHLIGYYFDEVGQLLSLEYNIFLKLFLKLNKTRTCFS